MPERKCSSYVSYQKLANWLCVSFLHSAQRTTQNQSSKPEVLAYCHEKNPDSEKQLLGQRTCLFHTALGRDGKTSDRHCLTLKPVCLPRGKFVLNTKCGCPHASLSLEISHCLELQSNSANGRNSGLHQTHQGRVVPALWYTWEQLPAPQDTGKRKIVNAVLLCISIIFNCLQRGGIILRSSTAASSPSPQPYQVPATDLGEAGITSPVKY